MQLPDNLSVSCMNGQGLRLKHPFAAGEQELPEPAGDGINLRMQRFIIPAAHFFQHTPGLEPGFRLFMRGRVFRVIIMRDK